MDGKALLILGLKREFGNGNNLDIHRDPWLLDDVPRSLRMSRPGPLPMLADLKETHSDQWSLSSLEYYLDHEERIRVLQVKPGGVSASHIFSWIYNSSGVYSVKSGYWLWSNSSLNGNLASEQKPNYSAIYDSIWSCGVSNKIRNFLWRALTSSLSVGHELRKKHIAAEATCKLCGDPNETVNHLFFHCDLAKEVWSSPTLASTFAADRGSSLHQNIWECIQHTKMSSATNLEDEQLGPWILWLLWKARNEFVFQNKTTSGQHILQRARIDAKEWLQHNVKLAPMHPPAPRQIDAQVMGKWTPPPSNYLKCNVDASWQDSHDRCGISWILRDSSGTVRLYGFKVYPRLLSSLEAEATTMVWTVKCMWNMDYNNIVFESDSSNLISSIHNPSSWPRLFTFSTEILNIVARRTWRVQFDHISRKKNNAADILAKHALSFSLYFGSIDNMIHSWLQPSLDC